MVTERWVNIHAVLMISLTFCSYKFFIHPISLLKMFVHPVSSNIWQIDFRSMGLGFRFSVHFRLTEKNNCFFVSVGQRKNKPMNETKNLASKLKKIAKFLKYWFRTKFIERTLQNIPK